MHKRLKQAVGLLFCCALAFISNACANTVGDSIPPSYHWGRGISWPAANLNIGGYFNSSYAKPELLEDKTTLEELALFITWSPLQRVRFFSEVEVNDWVSTEGVDTLDNAIRAERLYVDLLVTGSTTLRIGKFLTPVGRWNVTHAAPLIWTSSRPLVTEKRLFTSHASGLMLTQRWDISDHNVDVLVYADDSGGLDVLDNELGFENAIGGRINVEISEQLQIAASFLDYKNKTINNLGRNDLFGLDLLWKYNDYEVQVESIFRHADDFQGDERGLFIQGVAPIVEHFYAIGRYEYLEGKHKFFDVDTHFAVTGLTWRPFVPLAIKAEYRFGSHNEIVAPSGFYTSISMFY